MIKKIFILIVLITIIFSNYSYATDEIISSQMDSLNISSFIKEGQKYTEKVFPEIKIETILSSALKGKIDNKGFITNILGVFEEELIHSFSLIATILVVVLIHSILKAFSDNLEKKGVSQIAYYVEYILIVTIIMTNFSTIIGLINESISNLVGFANTLVPILLSLMSASRMCCICNFNTTNNFVCNSFYCKFNNVFYFTINIYWYCNINNF